MREYRKRFQTGHKAIRDYAIEETKVERIIDCYQQFITGVQKISRKFVGRISIVRGKSNKV